MTDTVLLFKADDGNFDSENPYITKLKDINLKGIIIPVLKFDYCNLDELKSQLKSPESFSGLALSSVRCVEAVSRCAPLDIKWKSLKCYCVGQKTAHIAETSLGLNVSGQNTGTAAALASYIIQDKCRCQSETANLPLLVPLGDLSQGTLCNALLSANINTVPVEVYHTVANPNLLESLARYITPMPRCLIYFSPSGVDATVPILKQLGLSLSSFKIGAIGPTTKAHLNKMGIEVNFCPDKPTPEHLVEAMHESFL